MNRSDILDLIGNLSVACMVMGSNLSALEGELAAALQDAYEQTERNIDALGAVLRAQDHETK